MPSSESVSPSEKVAPAVILAQNAEFASFNLSIQDVLETRASTDLTGHLSSQFYHSSPTSFLAGLNPANTSSLTKQLSDSVNGASVSGVPEDSTGLVGDSITGVPIVPATIASGLAEKEQATTPELEKISAPQTKVAFYWALRQIKDLLRFGTTSVQDFLLYSNPNPKLLPFRFQVGNDEVCSQGRSGHKGLHGFLRTLESIQADEDERSLYPMLGDMLKYLQSMFEPAKAAQAEEVRHYLNKAWEQSMNRHVAKERGITPFVFHLKNNTTIQAENEGFEGFAKTLRDIVDRYGVNALQEDSLESFQGYLRSLSEGAPEAEKLVEKLERACSRQRESGERLKIFTDKVKKEIRSQLYGITENLDAYLTNEGLTPFVFRPENFPEFTAFDTGLEGFVYCERLVRERLLKTGQGIEPLLHQLPAYFIYMKRMLEPITWAQGAYQAVVHLETQEELPNQQKYLKLVGLVSEFAEQLRGQVKLHDAARSIRSSHSYSLWHKHFNLEGFREAYGIEAQLDSSKPFLQQLVSEDLKVLREEKACDVLYLQGMYPSGEKGAIGPHGTPFALKSMDRMDKEFGTPEDFVAIRQKAKAEGISWIMFDIVPNHTSLDADWLQEDPTLYIHEVPQEGQEIPKGHFEHVHEGTRYFIAHGGFNSMEGVQFFNDTAQLDYSNPKTQARLIQATLNTLRAVAADDSDGGALAQVCMRIDMAYTLTREYHERTWGRDMGPREFLEKYVSEIKSEFPQVAVLFEGYDVFDYSSFAGPDLFLNKNNMKRGVYGKAHIGLHDALANGKDFSGITEALEVEGYRFWQVGGPGLWNFVSNHDEGALRTLFRPDSEKAPLFNHESWKVPFALTTLLPGAVITPSGLETGVNLAKKSDITGDCGFLPYRFDSRIDWTADEEIISFTRDIFGLRKAMFETSEIERISQLSTVDRSPGAIAYRLDFAGQGKASYFVLGNNGQERDSIEIWAAGDKHQILLEPGSVKVLADSSKGLEFLYGDDTQ